MSSFVKHQAPPSRKGVRLTILITVIWAVLLAGIGFLYQDATDRGGLPHFIARFHVLAVHLPIGVIFLALAMEALGYFTAFSHLRPSIPFVLWIGFLGAVGATVMGYLLMSLEDYSGSAMTLHLWFGLAVVVLSAFALIFSLRGNRILTGLGILGAAFTTAASGHFGGAMVHDADYLTEFAPAALKPALEIGLAKKPAPAGDAPDASGEAPVEVPIGDRLVYADFVVPILEKTCNECHNENKIKGKLRLDTHELIMAGAEGSDFPTVVPGDPEQSELLVRVLLPEDDDEFMPPQGDPLQPAEIELLKLWIQSGAKTETKVAELGSDPAVATTVAAVAAIHAGGTVAENADATVASIPSVWDTLGPEEQEARLTEVNEAAAKYNFSVMPISAEDTRLRINVINGAKDFGDDQLKLIEPVAERVVWLDLGRSRITDQGMKTVRRMRDLERLHLENTAVTDAGIAELAGLARLEYLNLYGTKVGNGIFDTFAKLPALRRAYLWQTSVDPARAKAYERSVNLEINTGSDLPEPPPAPAPQEIKAPPAPAGKKPEEKKEPAKKPDAPKAQQKPAEQKPAEPKPAAPKPAENKADAPKPAPAPAPKPADTPKVTPTSKPADAPKAEAPKPVPAAPAPPAPPVEAPKSEAPKPVEPKPAPAPAPEPKKEA